MAFSPITSWQMNGEKMETVIDFIFLGSKITADGDCSHEIKRQLLLGRKAMTNLDCLLKSRNITLPTKVRLDKAIFSPVVMYRCESWTIKRAEHQRIHASELWCWRRLLRVPWAARSNQSILKQISAEYSLEGLMLKLKLQYVGHLMWRTDSLEKTLILERLKVRGEGDNRGWDGWMAISTRWIGVWVSSRDGQGIWHAGVHGVSKSRTWLSNWTELYWTFPIKQLEKEEQTKPKANRRKKNHEDQSRSKWNRDKENNSKEQWN